MEVNKDKGTSVGFSDGINSNFEPLKPFMNKECKEHEWETLEKRNYSNMVEATGDFCKLCGKRKPKTDFKISENLDQINKQEWEDIWNEFQKENIQAIFFISWLKENYTAPEKK